MFEFLRGSEYRNAEKKFWNAKSCEKCDYEICMRFDFPILINDNEPTMIWKNELNVYIIIEDN